MSNVFTGNISDLVTEEEYLANKPTIGKELKKGIGRGIDLLQANAYGALAAHADVAKANTVRDWAEKGQQSNMQEAAQNPAAEPSFTGLGKAYTDGGIANGIGRTGLWAAGAVGELAPQGAAAMASGAIGKRLGGGAGSAGLMMANNVAQETGSIYGDILEKTGKREGATAIEYGIPAALIDTAVEAVPVGKVLGSGLGSGSVIKDVAKAGVKQLVTEAPTEAIQTGIERAAVTSVDPDQQTFTPEGWREIIDSAAAGGIGGAVSGAGAEGIGRGLQTLTQNRQEQGVAGGQPEEVLPVAPQAFNPSPQIQTDPIARHVDNQVQAAASVDPSGGPLSKAVSTGVETGAVAIEAVKQAASDPAIQAKNLREIQNEIQANQEAKQAIETGQALLDAQEQLPAGDRAEGPDTQVAVSTNESRNVFGLSPADQDHILRREAKKLARVRAAYSDPATLAMAQNAKTETARLSDLENKDAELNKVRAKVDGRLNVPEFQDQLVRMADNAGWEEIGGRVIMRDLEGNGRMTAVGRTPWAPKEEWFVGGLGSKEQIQTAVRKAINGEKLGDKQRQIVEYMLDFAGENIITTAQRNYEYDQFFEKHDINGTGNMTEAEMDEFFNSPEFMQPMSILSGVGMPEEGKVLNPEQEALVEFVQDHAGDPDVADAIAVFASSASQLSGMDGSPETISKAFEAKARGDNERQQQEQPISESAQGESTGGIGRGAEWGQTTQGEGILQSYTSEEIAAKEKAAADAASKAAQDAAKAEQKARADAERGDFQLTGSDRPADVAAAAGQNDLFGAGSRKKTNSPEISSSQQSSFPETSGEKESQSDGTGSKGASSVTYWADRASDLHDVAVVLRDKISDQPNSDGAVAEISHEMVKFQLMTMDHSKGRRPTSEQFKEVAEALEAAISKYTGGQDIDVLVEKYGSFGTKALPKPVKKNVLAEAKAKKQAEEAAAQPKEDQANDNPIIPPEPKEDAPQTTEEPNLLAARDIMDRYKKIVGNKVAEGKIRKEMLALASKTDLNEHPKTAMALDMLATRLGYDGDMGWKESEVKPQSAVDPRGKSKLKDISAGRQEEADHIPDAGKKVTKELPAITKRSNTRPKKASDAISVIKGILNGDDRVSEDKAGYDGENKKTDDLTSEQRAKLGQAALQLAEYYLDSGLTKFSDFARQMLNDIGTDKIKPFIEAAYMGGRANLRQTNRDLYAGTDKPDTVEALVDSGFLDDLKGRDVIGDSEEDQQDDEPQAKERPTLQDFIIERMEDINDNNDLKRVLAEYHGQQPTEAQIKEGQEAVELGLVILARDVVASGDDMRYVFDELLGMYKSQPNLNSRTSTSMANQAYSTPLPLAFLAGKLAGAEGDAIVYEPTAGNGALLMAANPERTHANELDASRRDALKRMGFLVTGNDATESVVLAVNVHAANNGKADAVVMNPPFGGLEGGAVKYEGYSIGKIDHLIAARALENMKDDGRATMIIGANKEEGVIGRQDRIFFNWLYSNYNVVDHFEVDGKLYSRQGAGWPVVVITVDGRKASDRVSPKDGDVVRLNNWEKVYDHAKQTLDSIGQQNADGNKSGTIGSLKQEVGRDNASGLFGGETGAVGQGVRPEKREGGSRTVGSRSRDSSGRSTGNKPGRTGAKSDPERSDSDDNKRNESGSKFDTDAGANRDNQYPQKYDPSRSGVSNRPSRDDVAGSGFQARYVSGSALTDDGALVPVNMRPAIERALENLKDAVGGDIDSYVMEKLKYTSQDEYEKAFMGLQADTIAAAIHNMENKNKGIIIADQTGVGKGRQGAGIMRWAIKNGKIPVFITVKPNLFTDIYDDSHDIGLKEISPFIMNKDGADIQKNGEMLFSMTPKQKTDAIRDIVATGNLPNGSNALFMTYSQITATDAVQRAALTRLVAENGDRVVFILDESHNVAGEKEKKKKQKGGGSIVVRTGAGFINDIITDMPVTYLSATYAKRPDNMPVYHRTDLMDAVDTPDDLINAAARGGEALQTVIANALARNGQLWRREKSYEGIEIRTIVESKNKASHEKLSDNVTNALKSIIDADNILSAWLEDGGADAVLEYEGITSGSSSHFGAAVEQHATHSPFTSVVHNYVRQMLLGLKAEWIVEEAIALKRAGKKPVIALENTMESFLKEAIDSGETKIGDHWDGDFSSILHKALKRTARITVEDNSGEKRRIPVPESLMPPVVRAAYSAAKRTIESLDISDIPIMPIDYIRHNLEQNGISTGEITGRSLFLDYSGGIPIVSRRSEEDMNRRGAVDRFNAGDIDAIILNSAGSTGLSIHSRKDYADLRPRHMLVAQPMLDINIMMQMLGRINRTGQVVLPEYSLMGLDLPAEKRPLAIANRKMASLNANTSANTKSDTSLDAPDIMNKYGAMVISNFLLDNSDIALAINMAADTSGEAGADFAIKATGRFALLSVEKQRYAYDEIERAYKDLIAFLDATGQNDLKTETLDLNASIINTTEIYEGKFPGTELGGNAYLHHVSVNKIGKPPTSADVSEKIRSALGKDTPHTKLVSMIDESRKQQDKIDSEQIEAAITGWVSKLSEAADEKERALIQDRLAKLHETKEANASAASETASLLSRLTVGTQVKLDIGDDVVDGVVVDVVKKYKEGVGSPWAASKYHLTFAVNSTAQYVTMPLSSMRAGQGKLEWSSSPSRGEPSANIAHIFKPDAFAVATERRYIATGNLVGAFAKLPSGRVINFTAANGKQYQGIMMPRKFGDKEMQLVAGAPKAVRDVSLIAKYLRSLDKDSVLFDLGVISAGSSVRVSGNKKGGYTITVPTKSDAIGDSVKFDKDLHAVIGGEFAGRGKYMTAPVSDAALERALEKIASKTPLNVPSIGDPVLDRLNGVGKKEPVKSFDILGEDDDGVAYSGPVKVSGRQDGPERSGVGVIDGDDDLQLDDTAPHARKDYSQLSGNLPEFVTATTYHAKNKHDLFVASIKSRVEREQYNIINNIAKRNDGWYSAFKGSGAIPGFQFKSEEGRQKFLDEVNNAFSDDAGQENQGIVSERKKQADMFRKPPGKTKGRLGEDVQADLFDDSAPKEIAPVQARENFFVRYQSVPVGQLRVGVKTISGPEDAAHAVSSIRKHAQETMMAIVVNKGGDILSVIRHSKGIKDASNVSPIELVAAAVNVPDAAGVWLAHNHPSGVVEPSASDEMITKKIVSVAEGTGVQVLGHVIVGHGNDAAAFDATDTKNQYKFKIKPMVRRHSFDVTERVVRKVLPSVKSRIEVLNSVGAKALIKTIEPTNAVILLNTQNHHIGTVAMTTDEMLNLRDGIQVDRLMKALDTTNAAAVIIKSEGSAEILNISSFFANKMTRVLDAFVVDANNNVIKEYFGEVPEGQTFFRRSSESGIHNGISRSEAMDVIREFRSKYKGIADLRFRVYETKEQAYGKEALKRANLDNQKISGGYKSGGMHVILEDIADAGELLATLRHEAWAHYGFDLIPPLRKRGVLRKLADDIKGNSDLNGIYEKIRRQYRDNKGNVPSEDVILEEVVASIAELYGDHIDDRAMESNLRAVVRKIIDAIADMLRSVGLIGQKDGMQSVLDHLIGRARYMREGGRSIYGGADNGFESRNGRQSWYYSALKEAAADMKQEKGSPEQMLAMLSRVPGVKPAEIEATGLKEFMQLQGKSVTKQQIMDYLQGNGVQVQETVLGAGNEPTLPDGWEVKFDQEQGLWVVLDQDGDEMGSGLYKSDAMDMAMDDDYLSDNPEYAGDTKYGKHVLPGGENYRELLLTLPSQFKPQAEFSFAQASDSITDGKPVEIRRNGSFYKNATSQFALEQVRNEDGITFHSYPEEKQVASFRSNHYDQPNILAHVRFNERTDAEGKRVLFIEEIQSDWAQQGRKRGFKGDAEQVFNAEKSRLLEKYKTDSLQDVRRIADPAELQKMDAAYSEWQQEKHETIKPPSAPFVTSTDAWVGLSMKRMIAYAAENGFDRIAWTTGEQQADRYDLSKQVDSLIYEKNPDGTYDISAVNGRDQIKVGQSIAEEKLEDYVGKDIAQKIVNSTGKELVKGESVKRLSGVDLKVGGEGMRSFYDKIVPKVAKEITKKMGGRITSIKFGGDDSESKYVIDAMDPSLPFDEEQEVIVRDRRTLDGVANFTSMQEAENWLDKNDVMIGAMEQPGFDITPEMRSAVESGLPLFRIGETSVQAEQSPLFKTRTADQVGAISKEKADEALKVDATAQKILAKGNVIKNGDLVGVRLNINVLNRTGVPVQSIHKGGEGIRKKMDKPGNQSGFYNGEVLTYLPVATLKNAFFTVHQPMREKIASGSSSKTPMASADGEWINTDSPSFDGVLARFNPHGEHLFIDQKGRAVKRAEEATIMGHRAYLRGEIEYYQPGEAPEKAGDSATNATFYDPQQPPEQLDDLFFRRASEGDASAVDVLKTHIQDRLQPSLNTFNWWNKSVGTQFHKAWKDKDYKKVFDKAQSYLNDTNRFAMESADLAPGLLPKVDSFADIMKSTGASRDDIEKIADSIYTGTLDDKKVYTNQELSEKFGLNDRQRALYREFRKAINHSLDAMTASEIAKEIKDDPELHGLVMMAKYRPERALEQVVDVLDARAEELEGIVQQMEKGKAPSEEVKPYKIAAMETRKTLQSVRDKLNHLAKMKNEGYAPLMRFGKYTVTVTNIRGEIEYFGMFEKQSDARAMERSMSEEYGIDAQVSAGVMSQEAYKLYAGMSPDTLELFGSSIGFDKSQSDIFQDYLRMSRNNRSALKRLIRRKGTAGFSKDVTRSLASFITSNARQASSNWHLGEMDETIEQIRLNKKEKGDVIDEAIRLRDYLRNPKDEAAAVRNLLFINYIGGSLASALTNMTQPITMTGPYLAQFGNATKHLLAAQKIGFGSKAEGDLGKAMERATDEGTLAPHEVYQLHSEAIRNLGSNLFIRKVITAWGRPFALAETYNRRLTFAAAYNMAKENPAILKQARSASPYSFAVKAVQETQGIYNKGNRPNWARGSLGATVFTFKQYSISYLEFLQRLPRKQQLQAIGILFLLAGINGLPFGDDIEDLIDTIAQMMGYNLHSRSKLRELAIDALGETAGDFIVNGASSLPGSPIDVQARMSLGNLIPGTGILKRSTTDKTRDVAEAVGPIGGMAMNIGQGIGSLMQGDIGSAAMAAAPNAVKNAALGAKIAMTGEYRDQGGRLIAKDVGAMDGVWKAIGFSPSSIAKESREVSGERQRIALARDVEAKIADRWAEAIVEQDADKLSESKMALADWNEKNPDTPIRITLPQIRQRVRAMGMDRRERLVKSAPKELRGMLQ